MKIIEQRHSLSDDDLHLLSPEVLTALMRKRLVVEFDEEPDIQSLDFSGCRGFYHIKSLGKKLYQFWFESQEDYDAFYSNIIAFKLSITTDK